MTVLIVSSQRMHLDVLFFTFSHITAEEFHFLNNFAYFSYPLNYGHFKH